MFTKSAKKLLFLFLFMFAMSVTVHAVVINKIDLILVNPNDDIVIIRLKSFENQTACSTNSGGFDYAFDGSTDSGKKMFSLVLAAQRSGADVGIGGSYLCTLSPGVENLGSIWIRY